MLKSFEIVKIHKINHKIEKLLCKDLNDGNIGVLEFQRKDILISITHKLQNFYVKGHPVCVVQEQDPELFLTINPNDKCKDYLGNLDEY